VLLAVLFLFQSGFPPAGRQDLLSLLNQAQRALQERNWTTAQRAATEALTLSPRDLKALSYLGSAYFEQGRLEAASNAFHQMLLIDPSNASAHYNLGVIAFLQHRPADSLPLFQFALKQSPNDVPALTGLLQSQFALKRPADARSTTAQLATLLRPQDPRYAEIAGLLASDGEYAAAINMFQRVRDFFPNSYDVNYNLALAYSRLGHPEDAVGLLKPFTTRAEAADLLGTIEEDRGNFPLALSEYRRAVELEPGNADYRLNLGAALLQCSAPEEAIRVFQAGLREQPGSWRLQVGLGAAFYIAGQYEDAAAAQLQAAQRRPDASIIYVLLAKVYQSAPEHQPEILRAFHNYLNHSPKDAAAYLAFADICTVNTDTEAARSNYTRALALDPALAKPHLQLGLLWQAQGATEQAQTEFETAIRLDPHLSAAHYRLALLYQTLGRTEQAKAEMAIFSKLKSETEQEKQRIAKALTAR